MKTKKEGTGRLRSPGLRPKIQVWVTFYPNNSLAGGKVGTVWLDEYLSDIACGANGVVLTGFVRPRSAKRSAKPAGRSRQTSRNSNVAPKATPKRKSP